MDTSIYVESKSIYIDIECICIIYPLYLVAEGERWSFLVRIISHSWLIGGLNNHFHFGQDILFSTLNLDSCSPPQKFTNLYITCKGYFRIPLEIYKNQVSTLAHLNQDGPFIQLDWCSCWQKLSRNLHVPSYIPLNVCYSNT